MTEPIKLPTLAPGETYIGVVGDKHGNLHHVILLPGDNNNATHGKQLEWAKSMGGDLPTRVEQAMLWANFRDQFQKDWYWSNELYEGLSGSAWCQLFYDGNQTRGSVSAELRARAVRRVFIGEE